MYKALIFSILFLEFSINIKAQHSKLAYLELGGNALFYSLNYDSRFAKNQDGLGFKIGVSFYRTEAIAIPVHLNYVIGKNNHALELGAGIYAFHRLKNGPDNLIYPAGVLAYRYQPVAKHFSFRAGWTPTFVKSDGGQYDFTIIGRYWPGISFGYKF
jgi:hypothetical protein